MKKHKDCPCFREGRTKNCQDCGGKKTQPLCPPVSEPVVYYRPLDRSYRDMITAGDIKASDVPLFPQALIVTHADRIRRGGQVGFHVEVQGWLLARSRRLDGHPVSPEKARWVDGLGWVVPSNVPPAMTYVEGIKGPAKEPGCWNWREDPS